MTRGRNTVRDLLRFSVAGSVDDRHLTLDDRDERIGSIADAVQHVADVRRPLLTQLGKQPPDSRVWVLAGDAPAFVRSEQPLYAGGPLWRIELTSPVWPSATHDTR